jgi:hypothetical protein
VRFDRFSDRRHGPGRRAADDARGVVFRARHRVAVAVARNPVIVGMIVATIIATIALAVVLGSQGTLRDTQHKQHVQQGQIAGIVVGQEKQRIEVTGQFCRQLNRNAVAANQNTKTLNGLILQSVKQSKAFEQVYRRFGFPPYAKRLRQAQTITRRFNRHLVPVLDCDKIVARIRRQMKTGPVGRLATHPH